MPTLYSVLRGTHAFHVPAPPLIFCAMPRTHTGIIPKLRGRGGDLFQEGKRTYLVSEGVSTARASTQFLFESQGHIDRGDDREYGLLPPDETTDSRHSLGKVQNDCR